MVISPHLIALINLKIYVLFERDFNIIDHIMDVDMFNIVFRYMYRFVIMYFIKLRQTFHRNKKHIITDVPDIIAINPTYRT